MPGALTRWEFIVVPTERLPTEQKTIGLVSLRKLGDSVQSKDLASTVERMVDARSRDTKEGYENGVLEPHDWEW